MAERASWSLGAALRGVFGAKTIDEDTWDDLESALIRADFGPAVTEEIVDSIKAQVDRYKTTDPRDVQRMLREMIEERLAKYDPTLKLTERPAVVLVVGVNGVGKTTTIGKFARFLRAYDRSVIVGAADTFRAAAVDQLATWAERAGAEIVRPEREGEARWNRDRDHRHRRPPAHEGRADGRARQDQARRREAGADQRGAARARRDDGPERARTGRGVHRARGRHRPRADEARRQCEGRFRAGRAGEDRPADQAHRPRRGDRRPHGVHAARLRAEARRLGRNAWRSNTTTSDSSATTGRSARSTATKTWRSCSTPMPTPSRRRRSTWRRRWSASSSSSTTSSGPRSSASWTRARVRSPVSSVPSWPAMGLNPRMPRSRVTPAITTSTRYGR